jgi:methyl-accepting chemotaxis protein
MAGHASEAALRGGEAVDRVVFTMAEIAAGSKRIADITTLIDGIAFQTNILALNASVEAARAGEQGRGFCMLADEVRSLAQKASGAAKEIRQLTGSSVEQVELGSRLAGEAGSRMQQIVGEVQRVAQSIAEIDAATQEQAAGIGQIGDAVSDLDRTTQQNAALVEESAAAAASLNEQAAGLTDLVGTFKLA